MKIICLQENLKQSLNITQNIIGKNLILPILNNLLLKTEKGRLRISATNLEIGINTWTSGKIEKEGEVTCPAKILTNFISNLPNKKIEIEAKNNNILIKCDNYHANIKGLPADDFPIIPKIKDEIILEIETEKIKDSLEKVAGVAAFSELRPEITGVLFKFEKNNLKLAATDSFRLAEKNITELNLKSEFKQSLIIPQRTIQELIRILNEKKGNLKVILGSNQILFDLNEAQLISRLIEGQYPDYQQIIPKDFSIQIKTLREELINNIRLASIFSSKINDIKFSFRGSKLEILAQDPDVGENKSSLSIEREGKDDDLNIDFNYRYLLDGLSNIKTKEVFIGLNSESTPVVFKPVGEEEYLYVVMPIKTN